MATDPPANFVGGAGYPLGRATVATDHAQTVRKALVAGAELAPAYAPDFGRAGAALDALVAERDEARDDCREQREISAEYSVRLEAAEAALGEARQEIQQMLYDKDEDVDLIVKQRDAFAAALREIADPHGLADKGTHPSAFARAALARVSPSTQADVADQ